MKPDSAPDSRLDALVTALVVFTRQALVGFVEPEPPIRNVIIRNFIARSVTSLVSIHSLVRRQHTGDSWTLFRGMTDRLFHLHWLGEHDEFEIFEQWSFLRQYEAQNRALSDSNAKLHRGTVSRPTPEQKQRYQDLKQKHVRWHRPNPEDAARSLQLPFLFKYGYDFASTYVHPMASDGDDEFQRLAGASINGDLLQVLENAVLVHTLVLQEGMNRSTLSWRKIVYDFIDAARRGIYEEAHYLEMLEKLHAAGPSFQWSQPQPPA